MKNTTRLLLLGLALATCLSSCSTAPKAPDPFDTMLMEAAKQIFATDFSQPQIIQP